MQLGYLLDVGENEKSGDWIWGHMFTGSGCVWGIYWMWVRIQSQGTGYGFWMQFGYLLDVGENEKSGD